MQEVLPLGKWGVLYSFCAYGLCLLLERLWPLRMRRLPYLKHLLLNIAVSLATFVVGSTVVKTAATKLIGWSSANDFGIVHWLGLQGWAKFIAIFLLMDLTFYYWHRANHLVPVMWRFHNVHHMDPDLDVSTGFRFHFFEVLYSSLFRAVQVALIGVDFTTFAIYELVFQLSTLFHHSNWRLPLWLEKTLNLVIVTPRMHGIHHSMVRHETNSNYSVIFCWWDKLHRTACLNVPQAQLQTGIAGYSQAADQSFWNLMRFPFIKQRDYWNFPNGTSPTRQNAARLEMRSPNRSLTQTIRE